MSDDRTEEIEEQRRRLADQEREAQERLMAARAALKVFNEEHPPETVVGH
jgi:hypothetical protein